jgi:Tol biopolymer transport system component/predicted Ser/Thr protein kinase
MDARAWETLKPLLTTAADLPPGERERFLEAHCSDPELRREALEMLASPAPLSDLTARARGIGAGSGLGTYRIEALLGRGGMGEVYRARDTRLGRDVAIKVLPRDLAQDPDRLARFQREAQALASLNHPCIATIYGLEEADGVHFIVMEYIAGQSLAERLSGGRLSQAETLRLGVQIADALEAAHRAGIIHRDLKPANVMLGPTGPKLLDFGLAKLTLQDVPTDRTAEGAILGTLQYMAPEQVEGRPADERSDVFAFGTVLYEMLAGRRPFDAPSQAGIIAAILEREPEPLATVRPETPLALQRVVARCLAKHAHARWQSMIDLREELKWVAETPARIADPPSRKHQRAHVIVAWSVAALAVAGWLLTVMLSRARPVGPAPTAVRAVVPPPADYVFGRSELAISPDGQRVAFRAWRHGAPSLWIASLTEPDAAALALPNTGGIENEELFFSPDGQQLGVCVRGSLQVVDLKGRGVAKLVEDASCFGETWSNRGTILYSSGGSIRQVGAVGGASAAVLSGRPPDLSFSSPAFLPDGRHFLVYGEAAQSHLTGVYLADTDTHDARFLFEASDGATYASPGLVLYIQRGQLLARGFDTGALTAATNWSVLAQEAGTFAVSQTGVLVYFAGDDPSEMVWRARDGTSLARAGPAAGSFGPRLSPDGSRIAYQLPNAAPTPGLWIHDVGRDSETRITSEEPVSAVWSSDGTQLMFGRVDGSIQQVSATGVGPPVEILHKRLAWPTDWSRDGRYLAYTYDERHIVGVRQLNPPQDVDLPQERRAANYNARFSPDGRWLAYTSDETGRADVYIVPFPQVTNKWKVSTNGGAQAVWRRDGRELFYIAPDGTLMAVTVSPQAAELSVGKPVPLFSTAITDLLSPSYDSSPDGQRFLINAMLPTTTRPMNVVSNWMGLLRK